MVDIVKRREQVEPARPALLHGPSHCQRIRRLGKHADPGAPALSEADVEDVGGELEQLAGAGRAEQILEHPIVMWQRRLRQIEDLPHGLSGLTVIAPQGRKHDVQHGKLARVSSRIGAPRLHLGLLGRRPAQPRRLRKSGGAPRSGKCFAQRREVCRVLRLDARRLAKLLRGCQGVAQPQERLAEHLAPERVCRLQLQQPPRVGLRDGRPVRPQGEKRAHAQEVRVERIEPGGLAHFREGILLPSGTGQQVRQPAVIARLIRRKLDGAPRRGLGVRGAA
jgi:hypothetical protein